MEAETLIQAGVRSIGALAPALAGLEECSAELAAAQAGLERGHFTPAEDELLQTWFARHLTARAALLETIAELKPLARGELDDVDEQMQLRCFVLAYAAACLLVRSARYLVGTFATDKVVQRKLNEAEPRFRIPAKQYTTIYKSLTSPKNAWQLLQSMRFADENRQAIDVLRNDSQLGPVVEHLADSEESLRVGVGRYARARMRYRWHALRRRRATAVQRGMFSVAEAFGRLIAEVHNPWHTKRVNPSVKSQLAELLVPGDVIITRHDDALSNLALPGYWPHAALHIGSAAERARLRIDLDQDRAARWIDPVRVLEARKDGVLFRELADTLAVDAVAVIRPRLSQAQLTKALSQAITHEGKLYNFDFDFFRADRLVCTEVVYRAYDGIGHMEFALKQRAGRLTLSAEDLLDMAVDNRGFEPIAVFGTEGTPQAVTTGPEVAEVLSASYR
ncbi:MAG: YiiX/YebB-like N1pC/P60 family cysteine hydrolase [Phycisphaerales bacterium]